MSTSWQSETVHPHPQPPIREKRTPKINSAMQRTIEERCVGSSSAQITYPTAIWVIAIECARFPRSWTNTVHWGDRSNELVVIYSCRLQGHFWDVKVGNSICGISSSRARQQQQQQQGQNATTGEDNAKYRRTANANAHPKQSTKNREDASVAKTRTQRINASLGDSLDGMSAQ